MKRLIIKIGKTGKRITAILGFVGALVATWKIYDEFSTKNITGKWRLTFKVEKCGHKDYVGDVNVNESVFVQNGKSVSGQGEKTEYNGEYLEPSKHRRLVWTGTMDGDRFNGIYVLHGLNRESEGHIEVTISSDGKKLNGKYNGTIASDGGTVIGEKID